MSARSAWVIRNKFTLIGIVVTFLAAFMPVLIERAQGGYREPQAEYLAAMDEATLQTPPAKEQVRVGVYILSVGNLNTTNGSYDADFFLNLACQTPPCDPTRFDIMNAAEITEMEDQTSPESRAVGKFFYRVRANLQTNLDLHNFPFDQHSLGIELEDKNKSGDQLQYVIDNKLSGIDSNVRVSGWSLEPQIIGQVVQHNYTVYEESYSRASFNIRIYHPWFSSFMKGLFAAIVIVMVGMLSFAMRHDATTDRLALTSSTLVGAILYHLTLTSSIPPVGYLTFADSFMMMNYVFVFLALGITVALLLFMDNSEEKRAIWLHKRTRLLVPLGWLVASIALTLLQFIKL